MDRAGAERPAQRPPDAALRIAVFAESSWTRADSTKFGSDAVAILIALRGELPRVVLATRRAPQPDSESRVHGCVRRAGSGWCGRANHRCADHRAVPHLR